MSRITSAHLADRWRILPTSKMEPVTIYARLANGSISSTGVAIGQAQRHIASKTVIGEDGVYLTEETLVWGLWASTFATMYEPKIGDQITDKDGVKYRVTALDQGKKDAANLYNCTCQRTN